jgi:hypothetical protein
VLGTATVAASPAAALVPAPAPGAVAPVDPDTFNGAGTRFGSVYVRDGGPDSGSAAAEAPGVGPRSCACPDDWPGPATGLRAAFSSVNSG